MSAKRPRLGLQARSFRQRSRASCAKPKRSKKKDAPEAKPRSLKRLQLLPFTSLHLLHSLHLLQFISSFERRGEGEHKGLRSQGDLKAPRPVQEKINKSYHTSEKSAISALRPAVSGRKSTAADASTKPQSSLRLEPLSRSSSQLVALQRFATLTTLGALPSKLTSRHTKTSKDDSERLSSVRSA